MEEVSRTTGNSFFDNLSNRSSRFHRILAMLLDHMIVCAATIPFTAMIIFILIRLDYAGIDEIGIFGFFIIIFVYLNKDFYRGKSLGKRIMGYEIVDINTNLPATRFQCFIRNLTIPFAWPIEVVVAFINPSRRIGDFVAETKVIKVNTENWKSIWTDRGHHLNTYL
ncbi:MAG: RDD family protein [Nonlabens sp.]